MIELSEGGARVVIPQHFEHTSLKRWKKIFAHRIRQLSSSIRQYLPCTLDRDLNINHPRSSVKACFRSCFAYKRCPYRSLLIPAPIRLHARIAQWAWLGSALELLLVHAFLSAIDADLQRVPFVMGGERA